MNDRPDPVLLRAALRIHEALCGLQERFPTVALPETVWAECLGWERRLHIARSRGWTGAMRRVQQRLQATLMCLESEVKRQLKMIAQTVAAPVVSPVPEILRDLTALEDEFDGTAVDLRQRSVTVRTEPVVLEGVDLGPFEIRLEWGHIGYPLQYAVVAIDARRSAVNDSVTHPHVEGDQLCEGDGRTAIREALRNGRLLDLFLIVRQILQTYNPSSAYVALDEWDGRPCRDCGASVLEDDGTLCHACESLLCGDCCLCCSGCSEYLCDGCLSQCGGCEQPLCRECLNHCPDCEGDHCDECLTEEGCCADCQAADRDDADSNTGAARSDRPAAAATDTP